MKANEHTMLYNGIEFRKAYPYLNGHILRPIEKFLGINFTEDYRSFLLKVNGGYPDKTFFKFSNLDEGSVVQHFYGINGMGDSNDLLIMYKYSHTRIPSNMVHIGADCFGNQILLSVKNPDRGKIYFWDHEIEADPDNGEIPCYDNLTLIANSFDEFLGKLYFEDGNN
jgi:hypothetical protein